MIPSWALRARELGPARWFSSQGPGSVISVNGAPRTGKSKWVREAAAAGVFERLVIFDPYNRRDRQERRRGRVDIFPWEGELVELEQLILEPELLDRCPLRLVVQPTSLDPEQLGKDFATLANLVWSTGGIDLIAEEAGLYSRWAVNLLMQLASGGGHVGMRLVLICQSFGRLAKDARRHASSILTFAVGEESDLKSLRQKSKAFAQAVQELQPGDPPLCWQLGNTALGESHVQQGESEIGRGLSGRRPRGAFRGPGGEGDHVRAEQAGRELGEQHDLNRDG